MGLGPRPPTQGEQGRFIKDLSPELVTLEWDETQLARWRTNRQRSEQVREQIAGLYEWDQNLIRYTPQPSRDDVNTMADFRDVERKKAALFPRTPAIALTTFPGASSDLQSAVALRQLVLNAALGPRECGGVGVLRTVQQALFDVLCPAGVGPVQIGYTAITTSVEQAVPVTGPDGQPIPLTDPLTGHPVPGQFQTQQQLVPVPIHEALFADRFSPKALLLPAELRTVDTETGLWIGYVWRRPLSQVRKEYGKPQDWQPGGDGKQPYFQVPTMVGSGSAGTVGGVPPSDPEVTGFTAYYKIAYYEPFTEPYPNPEILAVLTLIDGEDDPVEHRLLPWQTITEQGSLTPDSFRGFPIDPLIVRDLSDQAWVPSDCAVTAALTKEQNRGRTIDQDVRKANRQLYVYDPMKLPEEQREAVRTGTVGTYVPVEPGQLDQGQGVNGIMAQVPQLSRNRQDHEWEKTVERDRELALGIGANQVAGQSDRSQTATEVSTVQRNMDARFEQEYDRVQAWFLRVSQKIDTLLTRYGQTLVPKLVGPLLAQAWTQTQPALGHYAYSIVMDSGKTMDVESQRRQKLQLLNMVGKAPPVNIIPIVKDIAQDYGYDPKQIVNEQPPAPQPEPLDPSLNIKGEDLNPAAPQYAGIYAILSARGVKGLPPPVPLLGVPNAVGRPGEPAPAPPIPAALPKLGTVNQHMQDESGQRSGPRVP